MCCHTAQAVTGTDEQPICSTPCTSWSLQRIIVTNIPSEPLPHFFTIARRLYISVALFLRSPWLDVIKHDCSVVLGLSSPISWRDCPAGCNYYITKPLFCQYQKHNYFQFYYFIKNVFFIILNIKYYILTQFELNQ